MNKLFDTTSVVPARRLVLAALLSASAAALIPWALAAPVDDVAHGSFVALSAILVGRQSLDAVQAKRLYDALTSDDAGFPAAVQSLLALINKQGIGPQQLQQVLDDAKSPLASLPRQIATAWFVGVVGKGAKARCLAYETALSSEIVADVLRPPSYSYGAYGSWSQKPL